MRDGFTRKLEASPASSPGFAEWLAGWRATIVVLSGDAAGTEFEIDAPSASLGRGAEATWAMQDDSMSKEHAVLEFSGDGMRLRDLGSMNGMMVNGAEVKAADLKHGDRFQLGESSFQFVLEERSRSPKTYVVED